MDFQLLGLSFITVFLAEIGDKSQVAAIALGGSSKHPRAVFLGSTVALVLASFFWSDSWRWRSSIFTRKVLKSDRSFRVCYYGTAVTLVSASR